MDVKRFSEHRSDCGKANLLLYHTSFLNELILAARRYVDPNAERVKAAYEEYMRPADLLQVIKRPPPK